MCPCCLKTMALTPAALAAQDSTALSPAGATWYQRYFASSMKNFMVRLRSAFVLMSVAFHQLLKGCLVGATRAAAHDVGPCFCGSTALQAVSSPALFSAWVKQNNWVVLPQREARGAEAAGVLLNHIMMFCRGSTTGE